MQTTETVGFPLSPQQERILSLDCSHHVFPYVTQLKLSITGTVDQSRLEKAVARVIAKHEILRTRFVPHPALRTLLQVIMPEGSFAAETVQLPPEAAHNGLPAAHVGGPFNLSGGGLLRCVLAHFPPEKTVFYLTLPSLCADAASMKIIARDLTAAYENPDSPLLASGEIQYADVAEHFNALLQSDVGSMGKQYWHPRLTGSQAPSPQPDGARTGNAGHFSPQVVYGRIDREIMAQAAGALGPDFSDEIFLLACWQVLLAQLSGVSEFAVGYAAAGRDMPELETCAGPFERYLPLVSATGPNLSFAELLRKTSESLNECLQWQNSFQWPEQENHHPVCFSFYDTSWRFTAGDARFSCAFLNSCTDRFHLKLSCAWSGDAVAVDLFYDPCVYSEGSARQIVEQFHTLTQSAGLDPRQPISEINAVSARERQRLMQQLSSSGATLGFEDVVARFEQQAGSAPGSTALICNQKQLTYRDLNQKANQLAHYLAQLGIGPECRIAICMERSPEMVVALLGALKAGAAYIPLDPAYPSERMTYMLKDADAMLVLTEERLAQRLPQEGATIVALDREWSTVAAYSSSNPGSTIAEQNLAYVIYTSGSTGRPKGVAVTRKGLANYVNWACRAYEFQDGSSSPLYSSIGFDLTVTSLWPCLLAGGAVTLAPEVQGIDAIATLAEESRPYDVLKITPAHLQMLKSVLPEDKAGISRRFVIGGEALDWNDLSYWRKHAPGTRLINEYGPTETVVGSCIYEVRDEDGEPEGQVPVGRPIASTQLYVLNANGDLCATGAPGELYIGGVGVARGYLNHPELTAERFVPDSCSGQPGERLYRTGDLARWRADGQLILMGRLDDQVKIRGFRIELGEIEALLKEDENIETTAVVVREDEPGNKQLVAYVVPKAPLSAIQLDHLNAYLKERLPEYMALAGIVQLPKLPLTTNGKLDRKALPKPELRETSTGEGEAPRSIIEEIVAGIWSQVLRREPIGRDANFFELGGHSLLATQVISRLRNVFDVELPLRALFAAPSVAGLAAEVQKLRDPIREPITARHAEIAPLSHEQRRLWSMERGGVANPSRNLGFAIHLTGSLNHHALAQALNEVVRRHEVLRTRFIERRGIPVQEVVAAINMEIEQVDAHGRSADELKKIAEAKVQQRFNLEQVPMIRAALLSAGAQEYIFVLAVHPIACDEASLDLIHQELTRLYSAASAQETCWLPELELQYGDFAAWEQSAISESLMEAHLSYSKTQLQGASPLELPVDHSQSSAQGYGEVPVEITLQRVQELKEFSREEGVTLSITLLTAFHVLLSKHSGQTDLVTGFGASRRYPEVARTLGAFANELIVRTDLSGNPAFRDLLAQERRAVLEGQEHQDVSFPRIAEELRIPTGGEWNPLFQVKFSLLPTAGGDTAWRKLQAEPFVLSTQANGLKLFLELRETSTGLSGTLHYAASLFSSEQSERLVEHYKHLLETCVNDAGEPISLLSVMPEAELQKVLTEWNNTRAEYPDKCAHELFEEQVARTPTAIAVEFEGQKLTYSELNQRANQLANYLRKLGVGPETLVGICVERSLEMMVGLLGVLKAGGAYLPLDPNYPTERIRYVLEDSEASVLLTQKAIVRQLPYFDGSVVRLDDQWAKIGREETDNVQSSTVPANLAYVIYTSGSTGKPKGVQVSHRALVNFLVSTRRQPGMSERDVLLAVTTLSFDIAGLELYLPLIAGGQVRILGREAVIDGRRLRHEVNQGVTIMQATPATWFLLLEAGWTGTPGLKVLCGGEALKPDLARKLAEFSGSAWNMYGPTETTIWSLTEELEEGKDRVSIGRPIANTAAYVLDQELMSVPRGVVGELFIGGDGLARGYIKRSDLTAERFVPDPFAQKEGGRLYRTGDLVRYSEAGKLEFVGRADHQVKVRGYRIELGEIEAALLEIGQIKQAVVAAREDARGEKQLIAYLVASRAITVGELREALKHELPDYMLPSAAVMLDALPLTANGKIDRRALPAPLIDSGREENRIAPRTQLEQIVADAWADVLQAPRLGIKDDVFDFGATSLLVMRALSRLRSALNVDIPVSAVFEASTVEALATAIELQIQAGSNPAVSPVHPVDRSGNLPLSYSQQRLWLYDQLEPGAPVNVPFGVRLRGELQKQVLHRTLNEIVRRHEVLRTRYVVRDGSPIQEIVAEMPVEIQESDLRNLPEAEREEAARKLVFEEAKASFDLGRGPLLRVKLLILSERDHVLLPTMHHIVSDGWSLEVMMREFTALYEAYCAGQPSPLPELKIQYGDYAVWQRQWLQSAVFSEQLRYWRTQLAGLPRLEMPTDFPRPAVPSGRGDNVRFELGRDFTEKLKRFSRRHGVTQYMTLLAALQVLLSRCSGQKDIVVGTDVANRHQLELEPMVGFFVNQVVIRTHVAGDANFLEVLHRVKQTTLDAFRHEDVPYERVVEDLQPERRATDGPLFQVKLVMQNAVRQDSKVVGLEVERFEIELDRVWLDLELVLAEVPAGIKGVVHYARDLFKHTTAERIIAHYKAILEAVLNNPQESISKLSFRQVQEQQLVARPRSENPPLSFAQQRMWFIHELEPESAAYNAHVPLRLTGTLDKEALSRSLNEIVRRHEVLRTTFPVKNGGPVQMIAPQLEVPVVEEDLTSWPADDREEEAKRRARAEAERPFDLADGPLLRVKLLCLSEREYVLLLTMHHIVSDGWSIGVLTREVGLLYEAYRMSKPSPLPELAIQYADYALWQREWLQGEVLHEQLRYWKKQLAGAPVLELPTDHPRPAKMSYRGSTVRFRLSVDLTEKLNRFSQAHGVTLFMSLLAGLQIVLSKYAGQQDITVGTAVANRNRVEIEGLIGFFLNTLVLRTDLSGDPTYTEALQRVQQVALDAYRHQDLPFEKLVEELQPERDMSRTPFFQVMLLLQNMELKHLQLPGLTLSPFDSVPDGLKFDLSLAMMEQEGALNGLLTYASDLYEAATIEKMTEHFRLVLEKLVEDPSGRISDAWLLSEQERQQVLLDWNDTYAAPVDKCIHDLFEEQAGRTPQNIAVLFEGEAITYQELNEKANQVAYYLRELGAGPEYIVGICVERSPEMLIGMLGILKAGAAYLPLEPSLPAARLGFMIEDSRISVLLTQHRLLGTLPETTCKLVCLDRDWDKIAAGPATDPGVSINGRNLAYAMYTSGSTGKPKGVMIEHRGVVNFFTGMDKSVHCAPEDTLLAVTGFAFDISVLELFWTLTRGAKVVLVADVLEGEESASPASVPASAELDYSLFYFSSVDVQQVQDKYRLLLEGAKYADKNDFSAVWTPERHFHQFGGLFPNPSVTGAAVAAVTERIQVRAGSVVLPLHNVVRVAEEWSVVDNLSRGRVGLAFASGWHADDFIFAPQNYKDRRDITFESIKTFLKLWKGEPVKAVSVNGKEIEIKIFPRPIQEQPPVWITAAGSPDTFIKAGQMGANVLTHLLGQSVDEVAEKIKLYREALAQAGHDPEKGQVALMLHTFLGGDKGKVLDQVRGPFTEYLRSSVDLIKNLTRSANLPSDVQQLSPKDMEALLAFAFDRYSEGSALFGTVKSVAPMIEHLKQIGVTEVAALVDFGVDEDEVLQGFEYLGVLKQPASSIVPRAPKSLSALAVEHQATLLQCTPAMLRVLMAGRNGLAPFSSLRALMVGGESLPPALAGEVKKALPCKLINMYGPTETTIWSATGEILKPEQITVGRPIVNTQIYILDRNGGAPVPAGVTGELYIGGTGLARGYLHRPELTADRFVPDCFGTQPGGRLYRTGDLARYEKDGAIEVLGRVDHQVKIRGRRIEMEEIEAALTRHPQVQAAAVMMRENGSEDKHLVGYIVAQRENPVACSDLREYLKGELPEYMVPSHFMFLDRLPLTPNGKLDRKALPAFEAQRVESLKPYVPPRTEVERIIADIWMEVLRVPTVAVDDNFFELGGHSLSATLVVSRIRAACRVDVPLKIIFEQPTLAGLSRRIEEQQAAVASQDPVNKPPAASETAMDQTLAGLENLSDDEVELLLSMENDTQ